MNALPRQKLCEIIKIYGKDVCSNHKRIRGLLNDFCRGNYPEINFLLMALEEKVDAELQTSSKTVPYEMISARLVEHLYANRGMANEIACWTVDSWALALGVISTETPPTKPAAAISNSWPNRVNEPKSYSNTALQQTIIVSQSGGQFITISAAIRNAPPDALILVKPGYYYEGLIIDKRIMIKGDGPREQIIVESRVTSCIQMRTNDEALVQGLTLRCKATLTNQKMHAVDIPMGRLKLLECDITSDTLACVAVRGLSTRPEIQNCWLHDANGSGLLFEKNAQGTIEKCQIYGNDYPNIAIRQYANPIVRKCQIYGGRNHGILVWENGSGTIEDCDIFGNASDGVKAKDGGEPTVRSCRIYKNNQQAPWVYQNGMGNTSFPRIPETQRSSSENRSEIYPRYTTEKAVYWQETSRRQEVAQPPEKRPNLIDLFLRSIHFRKGK